MENKRTLLFLLCSVLALKSSAQLAGARSADFPDSVKIRVHPSYDKGNATHRKLFGENYRKEWAAEVELPLVDITRIKGGLSPLKYGGGMETKSIRLLDKKGQEWVIRSVEKIPDKLLPANLRQTFALDWVDDEYSGQHPYSALIVPPLAAAAKVPYANPVIGVLVDNPALGTFGKDFAGKVVLFEEREPAGKSENTLNMLDALREDPRNRIDGEEFLRARMLDMLIGDWDRHEDQWRWAVKKTDRGKVFTAVPRDRDQVFHVDQGVFMWIATLPWIDPSLGNFNDTISRVKYDLFKTKFMQPYPDAQFSYERWMQLAREFVQAENDAVLAAGVARLPAGLDPVRQAALTVQLKKRRDRIPAAMAEYYRFINRIVDIRTSDKDDQVTVSDAPAGALRIVIRTSDKKSLKGEPRMDMTYTPDITREIRLFLLGGNDGVRLEQHSSAIKLRIVGGQGAKTLSVSDKSAKVDFYGRRDSLGLEGARSRLRLHLDDDTVITRFRQTNHYSTLMPLATGALNRDDGFLLGLGFRYTGRSGFRKEPYSTLQELVVSHSFKTQAFRLSYKGEWIQAAGNADLTLAALVNAPDNTMNFFGQGDRTVLNKTENYQTYYRARFDLYQLDPALRWPVGAGSSLSIGPSLQYYRIEMDNNVGRSLNQPGLIRSYDSTSFDRNRAHLGLVLKFISNKRDNQTLPVKGYLLDTRLQAYSGINKDSRGFGQLKAEFTWYQKIDSAGRLVLSDRLGGGLSLGHPAFYQSLFLGGQGNLLGYLQNRFAGQQLFFNNFQARYKIANIAGYILPGQIGVTGFYDIGRVWIDGEHTDLWHQGTGGGLYFSPASLTVVQVLAGHSKEGWYPYVSFNFRL